MSIVQGDDPEGFKTIIDFSGLVDTMVFDGQVHFVIALVNRLHRLYHRMVPSFFFQGFLRVLTQGDEVFFGRDRMEVSFR